MAETLNLSYSQQGLLGTSYLLSYLVVVALVPGMIRTIGASALTIASLLLIAVSLAAMAFCNNLWSLMVCYAFVGLGSGGANVSVMSLVPQWFYPSHRGRAGGYFVGGSGLAIVISGIVVPRLEPVWSFSAWQSGWLLFGVMSFLVAILCSLVLRNRPDDMGLKPFGTAPVQKMKHEEAPPLVSNWRPLIQLGFAYAIFAATYMVYASFIVTTMVDTLGFSEARAGNIWAWIGFFSLFSGAIFGYISDRLGRVRGLILTLGLQAIAHFLIASDFGLPAVYGSIFLFGITVWGIPTIMAAASGDYLGMDKAASGFAVVTLMFALGQTIGPGIAGILADKTGDFLMAYMISAGLSVFAILLCALSRPPSPTD